MRKAIRQLLNTLFSGAAMVSVLLMAAALLIILAPMLARGVTAVVFKGTFEWRLLQYAEPLFHRGDEAKIEAEGAEIRAARQPVYDILQRFGAGIDTSRLADEAKRINRELGKQLQNRMAAGSITSAQKFALEDAGYLVRDALIDAYDAMDNAEAAEQLTFVLDHRQRDAFDGTHGEALFRMAEQYAEVLDKLDLSRRDQYAAEYAEVRDLIVRLFGPPPGATWQPELMKDRYGATRWDEAEQILRRLQWKETWVAQGPGEPLKKVEVARKQLFAGTEMARLLELIETDAEAMLHPRLTFYWQYFIDDSNTSHRFGGIWPEIYGTLMLTVLTMAAAVPVGIATAAYLVECTRDSLLLRAIRTCINTLAGVPSIVFGLFGLAFFLQWVQPRLGMEAKPSILAGALTMAVLVLPIIIRASEEAIKSVPPAYKEAALSVGAGGVRTFLTVTLPAAAPGILTGIILSMSRAAGETAPILFVAAVWVGDVPNTIFEGGTRALSYSSYMVAAGDRVAMELPHVQYGMIMTLILLVVTLNIAAIVIRWRMARRLRGA